MPRMHQINDDDLGALEQSLPQIADALEPVINNRLRVQIRQVKKILSDVRWNYGPPSDIEIIPADDQTS